MIKPLRDQVLVQAVIERKMSGQVLRQTNEFEHRRKGIVLAVGTGRVLDTGERLPIGVNVGDNIIFMSYSGVEVEKNTYLISERDVLATEDKDD